MVDFNESYLVGNGWEVGGASGKKQDISMQARAGQYDQFRYGIL